MFSRSGGAEFRTGDSDTPTVHYATNQGGQIYMDVSMIICHKEFTRNNMIVCLKLCVSLPQF